MGMREWFKLSKEDDDPALADLQKGYVKNMKTPEIIFPPTDEHGRFVPRNRPTNGKP